jgi:entericidin B
MALSNKGDSTMMKAIKVAGLGAIVLMTAACNTIAGAGKDIQEGGEAVEQGAEEVKEEIDEEVK